MKTYCIEVYVTVEIDGQAPFQKGDDMTIRGCEVFTGKGGDESLEARWTAVMRLQGCIQDSYPTAFISCNVEDAKIVGIIDDSVENEDY